MSPLAWKALGAGSAVAAGALADRLLHAGWRFATGKEPPTIPEDPDTSWGEAMAWAALSGAAIGLARMFAARRAAISQRNATGRLPASLRRS